MDYRFSDDQSEVSWSYKVAGVQGQPNILFVAKGIRRERTGTHARVGLFLQWESVDQSLLGYDTFNIGRSEERTKLSRTAHGHLDLQIKEAYPESHVRRDLDLFCLGLEEFWDDRVESEKLNGLNVQPTVFALKPYILEGGGTILFAPPGHGKSYLMMLMAQSMQHGIRHLWEVHDTANVLFVNLERSKQSVERRVAHINKALGLGPEAEMHALNMRGKSLQELEDAISRTVKREKYEVLFLDSISRTAKTSLNDDTTANNIINILNDLAPTWMAIGHTPRQDTDHVFGSQMWDAGADVIVQVARAIRENGMAVMLTMTKANDIRKPPPQTMFLEFDEDGLIDARPAKDTEYAELQEGKKVSEVDRLREYLLSVGSATQANMAEGTGIDQGNISRYLKTKGFVVVGKEGRQLLHSVAEDEPPSRYEN